MVCLQEHKTGAQVRAIEVKRLRTYTDDGGFARLQITCRQLANFCHCQKFHTATCIQIYMQEARVSAAENLPDPDNGYLHTLP